MQKKHTFPWPAFLTVILLFLPAQPFRQPVHAAPAIHFLLLRHMAADALIHPENDLVYLGAFRLPDETSNGTIWNYGGHGMTYYPLGDPGSNDDFPGSLFAISHVYQNYVSEFTIPKPVISATRNVEELNKAQTLQPFADITGGRQTGGLTGTTLGDMQYMPAMNGQQEAKLYWVLYEYYMPPPEDPSFGWSGLDLAGSESYGLWRIDGETFSSTSKYLFEIPSDWASENTPGHLLAAGRFRLVNGGSWGPALYAISPWNENNGHPPPPGTAMDSTRLLYYPDVDHRLDHFSAVDTWDDGVWLTTGHKSAVVFVGTKGIREYGDLEYYGIPQQDGCGGKGYHGEPYYPAMLFYDPADLAKVASGTLESHQPQPYAWFNIKDLLFSTGCGRDILGGVGFDREHGLLYIIEKKGDGYEESKPIVHAWKLVDSPAAPDTTPPSTPTGLHATSVQADSVCLEWNPSNEDTRLAGYLLFRNGEPVSLDPQTSFCDTKVNPEGRYVYAVQAWDSVNQTSNTSDTLLVETPGGIQDTVLPIISGITVVFSAPDQEATISFQTDELTTATLEYGLQYSQDTITLESATLSRTHTFVLPDLLLNRTYSYTPTAEDRSGNINDTMHRGFRTESQ
jgi:hypothetical protein